MSKKVKVVHVLSTMNMGGIETFIMNLLRNKQEDIEYSFLLFSEQDCFFRQEIDNLNCKVFYAIDIKNTKSHIKHMIEIFKREKFDVVHAHSSFYNATILFAAMIAKIKTRISHAHGAGEHKKETFFRKIYTFVSRLGINIFANVKCACSKEAGEFLYGKNAKGIEIIENGIDINKLKYNSDNRKKIRDKYEIDDDKLVIGHIGRFSKEKNHKFIIDLFEELNLKYPNSELWFIGEGILYDSIKNNIENKNISSKVRLIGTVLNIEDYLSAMDVFIFPSIHEGLGISLLEAQCNGLKCVVSDTISKLAIINPNVVSLDLQCQHEKWIFELVNNIDRIKEINMKEFKNFDIMNATEKMEKIYMKSYTKENL